MRYAVIARHRDEYPVRLMCRVLEVAPAGYYAWRKHATPTARAMADERLLLSVSAFYARSGKTYGAPRIHQDLRAAGERVGKKRVARLMREQGLVGRRPGRRVRTTDSTHAHPIAPNVLQRAFDVNGIQVVNRAWVSDISVPQQAA